MDHHSDAGKSALSRFFAGFMASIGGSNRRSKSNRASRRPSSDRSRVLANAVTETLENRTLFAVGMGLVANYYTDSNFQNLAIARTDTTVDFNWGYGSPASNVPAEGFSARWTGQVVAPTTGTYTLKADSAGGMRVLLDGKTLINDWTFHSRHTKSGSIKLTAGDYHDITIEYRDQGTATARLLWSTGTKAAVVVPTAQLYRLGTAWVSNGWISEKIGTTRTVGGSFTSTGDTFNLSSTPAAGVTTRVATASTIDNAQFAYKTLRGDGEIVLKLNSFSSGSEANVIFRNTLDANSPYVDLSVNAAGAVLKSRATVGGSIASSARMSLSGANWLKVVRDANSFAGYVSKTGAEGSWTLVGTAGVMMDTWTEVGMAVSGQTSTNRASVSSVRVSTNVALGGNLQKMYDSSADRPFVDLIKLNTGFQLLTGKPAPVDSNGWPTVSDFQVWAASNGNIAAGRYTITFTGPSGAYVQSLRYQTKITKGSYNASTGVHIWYADVPANQYSIGFQFRNTGHGLKDIRVLQPGYSPVNTPIYTSRWLNFLKAYKPSSLRFMDWLSTNESTDSSWSQRSTPGSANWVKNGVSIEAVIELCNQVGSNLYINIPGRANDDYVKNEAALIRSKLRSDLNVYVEAGNELWATNFANGGWNRDQAVAEVKAGHSNLSYDGNKDSYTLALRRTARRGKQISDIFKSVWQSTGGGNPINTRVRVMLAAQVGNGRTYTIMEDYIKKVYGTPSNYFYAIAAAPYFTPGVYRDQYVNGRWTALTTHATKDQILQGMASSSGSYPTQHKYLDFAKWATPYGLKLAVYEGGVDTFGPNNITAKREASLDPRMKTYMKQYLAAYFSQGGTVFHYYTFGTTDYDSAHGTWTITNQLGNTNTPKSQAFKEVRFGSLANAAAATGIYA